MNSRRSFIVITIIIIVTSTLACGLFSGTEDSKDDSTLADNPAENFSKVEPESEITADDQISVESLIDPSESLSTPSPELGDEYRSEEGGYVFKPIPNYEFDEFFGMTTMLAPDADPDLGPVLMLIGGQSEEELTGDGIFNEFMKDAKGEDFKILSQEEITVDKKSGLIAEIARDVDGQPIIGRIVIISVTPNQQFTMFASAPGDQWGEFEPSFKAVLDSISFFKPQEINLNNLIEENTEDGSESNSTDLDISSLEEFPTEANQLPPGGFAYMLASNQGFPTIITDGIMRDQSTNEEYIISLISEDQNNTLTLYIPFNVSPGIYPMAHFNPSTPTNAPGAMVDKGITRFTNTDGIIMIDSIFENKITGSVFFTAIDEDSNEIAVSGFFNQLPLVPR